MKKKIRNDKSKKETNKTTTTENKQTNKQTT